MKYSCCINIEKVDDKLVIKNLDALCQNGYECVELQSNFLYKLEKHELDEVKKILAEHNMECKIANYLLIGGIFIVGEKVDDENLKVYAEELMEKLHYFGIEKAVLGSGKAREIPEGYDKQKAHQEIVNAIRIFTSSASKYGIEVDIEQLNTSETNHINSFKECCDLIREVGADNFGVVLDYYHFAFDKEDLSVILEETQNGIEISHVHIATVPDRHCPRSESDVEEFFSVLKQIGYDKIISLECIKADIDEGCKESIKVFKKFF